jgi:hypothetical protein
VLTAWWRLFCRNTNNQNMWTWIESVLTHIFYLLRLKSRGLCLERKCLQKMVRRQERSLSVVYHHL